MCLQAAESMNDTAFEVETATPKTPPRFLKYEEYRGLTLGRSSRAAFGVDSIFISDKIPVNLYQTLSPRDAFYALSSYDLAELDALILFINDNGALSLTCGEISDLTLDLDDKKISFSISKGKHDILHAADIVMSVSEKMFGYTSYETLLNNRLLAIAIDSYNLNAGKKSEEKPTITKDSPMQIVGIWDVGHLKNADLFNIPKARK